MYVSCSTWNSKHWWVEAVDIADGRRGRCADDGAARRRGDRVEGRRRAPRRRRLAAVGLPAPARRRRRRGRPDDVLVRDEQRRHRLGLARARRSSRPPGAGTPAAPGSRACCRAAAAGWPSTTAAPARRRTGTSAPASRSATRPAQFTADGPPTPEGQTARYLSVAEDARRATGCTGRPHASTALTTCAPRTCRARSRSSSRETSGRAATRAARCPRGSDRRVRGAAPTSRCGRLLVVAA